MAKVKIYKTNPIEVPKSSSIQKDFPRLAEIDFKDRNKIDAATIFFDVFVHPKRNSIVALGPELLNLKEDLFPVTIVVNDEPIEFRFQQIKHIVFIETEKTRRWSDWPNRC